jgi:Holliday junction DNA helicase RuvB
MDHEPANRTKDAQPQSIKHIIGQKAVVESVETALDSAMMDGTKFEHSVMLGFGGLGKTSVAEIISKEMCVPKILLYGHSIRNISDLHSALLMAKEKTIIFIDEAHELKPEFQVALYLAMDRRQIILKGGNKNAAPQCIPLCDFTLLLASTHEHCLCESLMQRMKLVLRFNFYSNAELSQIVAQRSKALGWFINPLVIPEIASRGRGVPRLAIRLAESTRRVCRSLGEDEITLSHLVRACELDQIDDLGLGPIEQRYLQIVADGSSRLNVISAILGLPPKTIQNLENHLIRNELILKDDQGRRQLTAKGREHVSGLSSKED